MIEMLSKGDDDCCVSSGGERISIRGVVRYGTRALRSRFNLPRPQHDAGRSRARALNQCKQTARLIISARLGLIVSFKHMLLPNQCPSRTGNRRPTLSLTGSLLPLNSPASFPVYAKSSSLAE